MTTITDIKTKAAAKLAAANARAEQALATPVQSPYRGQPGASVLEPMLAELKEMRRHLAEDWPASNLHDLNIMIRTGHCSQAEAERDHAAVCQRIGLRVAEFDKAIASIQALLDLGSPTG